MSPMNTVGRLFNGIENGEISVQMLVKLHDSSDITTTIAVVRSTPNSDHILLFEPIDITLLDQLMSSTDKFKSIMMIELFGNLRSIEPTCSSHVHCLYY